MVEPGDEIVLQFTTTNASGALANADSLPTGTLVRNGVDTAETATVTNLATGRYKVDFTVPVGYSDGDTVQMRIDATISTVSTGAIIWQQDVRETYALLAQDHVDITNEIINGLAGLNDLDSASVQAAVQAGLTAYTAVKVADLAGLGGGVGAIECTITVETAQSQPIAGCDVWVTSDTAGLVRVASGRTDPSGEVIFYLDAGTYYVWKQCDGYDFTNPETIVVS